MTRTAPKGSPPRESARLREWEKFPCSPRSASTNADCSALPSELDGDEVVHLKAGDTLVQRGGIHTWMNRGTMPAVMVVVETDATPVEAGGKVLRTQYPV